LCGIFGIRISTLARDYNQKLITSTERADWAPALPLAKFATFGDIGRRSLSAARAALAAARYDNGPSRTA